MKKILLFGLLLFNFWNQPLFGQHLYPKTITTNGVVNSVVKDGNTLYLGGSFNKAGFYTGAGTILTADSDWPISNFPAVNGTIHSAIPDGTGGWYIGGSFWKVGNVDRQHLAHVLPNGTVDLNFTPEVNSSIRTLVLHEQTLYLNGTFSQVNGQARPFLAAVDKVSGALKPWNPSPSGQVNSLVVKNNRVYLGGTFREITGKSASYFATVDATSGLLIPGLSVNATVNTVVQDENTVYVGGSFSKAGAFTGAAALLNNGTESPNLTFPATLGDVNTAVPDGNGGWYIAGSFYKVGNSDRENLAHILPNGTVDPDFNPKPNGAVQTLVLVNQTLYLGGLFSQVNGQERKNLAAIRITDGQNTNWNPQPNASVSSLLVNAGVLYVGGAYTQIGGQSRSYLSAFTLTDGALTAWNPAPNGNVNTLVFNQNRLYVGGSFNQVGGQSQRYIASFDVTNGTLLPWNPQPNNVVYTIAASDETIYIGGNFTLVGSQNRRYLAALNKTDGQVTTWNPQVNNMVKSLVISGSQLYVAGRFTQLGNQTRPYLGQVSLTDGNVSSWNPRPDDYVESLVLHGTNILCGGYFGYFKAENRSNALAINTETNELTSWNPQPNASISAITISQDVMYIGGYFSQIGGQQRRYLAALNKAGQVNSWNPTLNNRVDQIGVLGSQVIVGGDFTAINNQERKYLAMLSASDGSLATWNPQPDDQINTLSVSGTSVFVGGEFSFFRGEQRRNLLAINLSSNKILAWNPNPDGQVSALALSGNTLYVGGKFNNIGGQARRKVGAINKNTGVATPWNPEADEEVKQIVVDEAAVYVSGEFTTIGGQPRVTVAALNNTTGAATPWNPDPKPYLNILPPQVNSLAVDQNVVYVGGMFSGIGGQPRQNLAAISKADGGATAWAPEPNSLISAIVLDNDVVYVAGYFAQIGGKAREQIAALQKTDGTATDWNPGLDGTAYSLSLHKNRLLVGGIFSEAGGLEVNNLALIQKQTGVVVDWKPAFNSVVQSVFASNDTIFTAGMFTTVDNQERNYLALFKSPPDVAEKANQTITFAEIGSKTYSHPAYFSLSGQASSGLPVTYTILEGPADIHNNTLYMTGVGTVKIKATQSGNLEYNAAAAVERTFCILPAQPEEIRGKAETCLGEQAYEISAITGATYTWALSGGGTLIPDGSKAKVTWTTPGTHTISLYYSGSCGENGPVRTLAVVVTEGLTGTFTNMLPIEGNINLVLPLTLSWSPVPSATTYEVYVWPASETMPAEPLEITDKFNFTIWRDLDYEKPYRWQIVAKKACYELKSPVQTFQLRYLPDLEVTEVQVPPTAFSGQPITLTWKIKNAGNGATLNQQWTDAVYLSKDALLNEEEDILLGSVQNFSALTTQESYAKTATFDLPQGLNDAYNVFVVTNAYNSLLESKLENNTGLSLAKTNIALTPPANLWVHNIITPNNTFSGERIDITYTVTNACLGSTIADRWVDQIYLSKEPTFNKANAVRLGSHTREGALATCESYTQTKTVKLPAGIFGEYFIYVLTDVYDNVYEHAQEENNTGKSNPVSITLTPPVDLVVSSITIPAKGSNKQKVPVQWDVANQGGSSTAGLNWADNVYLSRLSTFNRDSLLLVGKVGRSVNLEPGVGTYQGTYNITIPEKIKGEYFVYVLTDADSTIFEYDRESNNARKSDTKLTIESPDLISAAVEVPGTALSGNSLTLTWRLQNAGPGILYDTKITDRVLLSASPTYQANATTEITRVVYQTGDLPAGADTLKSLSITLPNGLSGNYYIFIQSDYLNNVYEGNQENNNLKTHAAPVAVTLGPWADLRVSQVQTVAAATAGNQVALEYTVKNHGEAATPVSEWTDKLYISNQPTWDVTKATFLRDITRTGELAKDESYIIKTSVLIPATLGGENYYIYVFTDGANKVYEHTDEQNNTQKSNALAIQKYPPVDLAVTALQGTGAGASGMPYSLQWSVINKGQAVTLPAKWADALYLSTDQVWDKDKDVLVSEAEYNGVLEPQKSYNRQHNFVFPQGVSGNFYLILVNDPANLNNDADRSNNYKLVTQGGNPVAIEVKLTPPANLTIANFSAPGQGTAGQPLEIIYKVKNSGIGPTPAGTWTDKVFLSADLVLDAHDKLVSSFVRENVLQATEDYTAALTLALPASANGDYALLLVTDANNGVYEHQGEADNQATSLVKITPQLQSDLVVADIILPETATAGGTIKVQWKLKNGGPNPAIGYLQEAVYLSRDKIKDVNDILIGTHSIRVNLPSQKTIDQSFTGNLAGVSLKDYYVLVHTDIQNNILEVNDDNNLTPSEETVAIIVPELPVGTLTQAALPNKKELYYKIIIPENLTNETLLLALKGDVAKGANEMYLRYNEVPSRAVHDFAHTQAYQANQEIVVPELKAGIYYLLVYGQTTAGESQPISLQPQILNYELRSVNANTGGNTGQVTVEINGSKLSNVQKMRLNANGTSLEATKITVVDPTKVFATFDLTGATLGAYNLIAENSKGEVTELKNGFTVVAGTAENLVTTVTTPPSTRAANVISISVQYTNAGNTDIVNPVLQLSSLAGAPIGFNLADLAENHKELTLTLLETNGPTGVLRPGASGTIIIYAKATTALSFSLLNTDL